MVWSLEDMLAPPGAKRPAPAGGFYLAVPNAATPSPNAPPTYNFPHTGQAAQPTWSPAALQYAAAVALANQPAASPWGTPHPASPWGTPPPAPAWATPPVPSPYATWPSAPPAPYYPQMQQASFGTPLQPNPVTPYIPLTEEELYAAGYYTPASPYRYSSHSRSKPRSSRSRRRASRSRSYLWDGVDSELGEEYRGRSREATQEWVRAHMAAGGTWPSLLPSAMRQDGVRPVRRVHWYDPTESSSGTGSTLIDDTDIPPWQYHAYMAASAPPAGTPFIPPGIPGSALAFPHQDLSQYDLHPLLSSDGYRPAMTWDITTFPSTALTSNTTPPTAAHAYFADPAFPSTPTWHLQQPVSVLLHLPNAEKWFALWGPIVVRPPAPPLSGLAPGVPPPRIRVQDVLDAIYAFFRAPLTPQDRAYMSTQEWWAASEAMARRIISGRTGGDLPEVARRRGVLRADLLLGEPTGSRFGGMWAMAPATVGLAVVPAG
ncbi:hypothetical protein MKEN_00270200 [Mycena kentingensis (nom. inval.)]|nr:hypothetical protein MKEN_00270200 [Mycena kentingensis (nom. inval.)]